MMKAPILKGYILLPEYGTTAHPSMGSNREERLTISFSETSRGIRKKDSKIRELKRQKL